MIEKLNDPNNFVFQKSIVGLGLNLYIKLNY